MTAGKRSYDRYIKACSSASQQRPALSDEVQERMWKDCSGTWYGWMLHSMASLSNAGRDQMYYLTKFIKFLGISRLGQDVLQNFGVLNSLRFSDGRRERFLEAYNHRLR